MGIELRIRWDGPVRGLAEQRLSVDGFAVPLLNLLKALRGRARNILTHGPRQEIPESVGRLATPATDSSVATQQLVASSVGISGLIQMKRPQVAGQTPFLYTDLLEQATEGMMEAIDEERRGVSSDRSVRSYLDSLPKSITGQEYTLVSDGQVLRRVSFGRFKLSQLVEEFPSLREIVGKVIGVGFDPGTNSVVVRGDGMEVTMESELVERALKLRGISVRSLYVILGRKKRLLQIDDSNRPRPQLDADEFIFKKWRSVIEALAK